MCEQRADEKWREPTEEEKRDEMATKEKEVGRENRENEMRFKV